MLRPFRNVLLAAGLLIAALPAARAAEPEAFSPQQKSAVEAMIRDYLLAHPEVVQDALVELDRRQKEGERLARDKVTKDPNGPLYASANQMVLGNPKGDVTLVEFFDYNCGYCKRALSDNMRLLEQDKGLRLVLKEFPVLGQGSVEASQVATAIRPQLKPEQELAFHTKLLTSRGPVDKARALEVVKEIGLDPAKVAKDMTQPAVATNIQESLALADQLGLTGTPSFVLGGEVIVGAVGYDELKEKISSVRKCGRASC